MANAELYHPLLEELGMYLPYNHIVNQIIYLEGMISYVHRLPAISTSMVQTAP